jgi:hypothetical protein
MYQGNSGSAGETYSEIFDVSDIKALTAELQIICSSDQSVSGTITGEIWQTSDPTLSSSSWQQNTTATLTGSTVGTITGATYTGLARFVRAKIRVPAGKYVTACFKAVGRES